MVSGCRQIIFDPYSLPVQAWNRSIFVDLSDSNDLVRAHSDTADGSNFDELFSFWGDVQSVDFGKCHFITERSLGLREIGGVREVKVQILSNLVQSLSIMFITNGEANLKDVKTILIKLARNKHRLNA